MSPDEKEQTTNEAIVSLIDKTSECLRKGQEGWGTEHLSNLISHLQVALTERSNEKLAARLQPILVETMNAMERLDYLRVADLLEYRIRDEFVD